MVTKEFKQFLDLLYKVEFMIHGSNRKFAQVKIDEDLIVKKFNLVSTLEKFQLDLAGLVKICSFTKETRNCLMIISELIRRDSLITIESSNSSLVQLEKLRSDTKLFKAFNELDNLSDPVEYVSYLKNLILHTTRTADYKIHYDSLYNEVIKEYSSTAFKNLLRLSRTDSQPNTHCKVIIINNYKLIKSLNSKLKGDV